MTPPPENTRASTEPATPRGSGSLAKPQSTADRVIDALIRLDFASRRHSQVLREQFGVTAPQIDALRVLATAERPLALSALSKEIYLRESTTSGVVDRLEREGLVRRTRARDDRRVVRIALSKKGRELAERLPRTTKLGEVRRVVAELPAEEANSFLATLEKVLEKIEPVNGDERRKSAASKPRTGGEATGDEPAAT